MAPSPFASMASKTSSASAATCAASTLLMERKRSRSTAPVTTASERDAARRRASRADAGTGCRGRGGGGGLRCAGCPSGNAALPSAIASATSSGIAMRGGGRQRSGACSSAELWASRRMARVARIGASYRVAQTGRTERDKGRRARILLLNGSVSRCRCVQKFSVALKIVSIVGAASYSRLTCPSRGVRARARCRSPRRTRA